MPPITIVHRMRDARPFRGAQARLASYLEREYAQVPFVSMGDIATACEVGKATVSRFVQRLGYEDFGQMKEELRAELYASPTSPVERHAKSVRPGDVRTVLAEHRAQELANVDATLDAIDSEVVSRFCADLARANRVHVFGQRFSYGVGFNLALLLQQLLPDVRVVDGAAGTLADAVSGFAPADHVILVAHKRVASVKDRLATLLAERSIPFSLITDLPPGSRSGSFRHARHVLHARTEGVGAFNTYVSTMAVAHAVAAALEQVSPTARHRLTESELALSQFDVFGTPAAKGGGG